MSKPKKIRKKDFEEALREYDRALTGYIHMFYTEHEAHYEKLWRAARKRLIGLFMDAKGRGN